jgi:hypothetical protein
MAQIYSRELDWFTQEFNASVKGYQQLVSLHESTLPPMVKTEQLYDITIPMVKTEQLYDITISETDFQTILHQLHAAYKHDELQKRFPGIREAWTNYMTVVSLTAWEYDQENHEP